MVGLLEILEKDSAVVMRNPHRKFAMLVYGTVAPALVGVLFLHMEALGVPGKSPDIRLNDPLPGIPGITEAWVPNFRGPFGYVAEEAFPLVLGNHSVTVFDSRHQGRFGFSVSLWVLALLLPVANQHFVLLLLRQSVTDSPENLFDAGNVVGNFVDPSEIVSAVLSQRVLTFSYPAKVRAGWKHHLSPAIGARWTW